MELSELAAYAENKYHIREQHKWQDFPGFSVLADPAGGKWVALLMRQWDWETGTEIQRCDIKCGRDVLYADKKSFLSLPFRMKGEKWVGVTFDSRTEPETVQLLFDRAVRMEQQKSSLIVLEDEKTPADSSWVRVRPVQSRAIDTQAWDAALQASPAAQVPERILQMRKLYEFGGGSFRMKCRNFYRQGKYMEDYEDDAPWTGEFRHYFPTYHELNIPQLRGYFTWRTAARKGEYRPLTASLAYIYIYELLCGIGTDSAKDTLQKMKAFESGFIDAGFGDEKMRTNLHRWMLDFAVLRDVPAEEVRRSAAQDLMEEDRYLAVLKDPARHPDSEIVSALCRFAGKKVSSAFSGTVKGDREKHIAAEVWRCVCAQYLSGGTEDPQTGGFFHACFGNTASFPWHPLANAVFWSEEKVPDREYVLNECRTFRCRSGVWEEERYESLFFDHDRLDGLLHETDRMLRKYLKTGHYLRRKPEEAWADVYIEQVLAQDAQAQAEAARPVITVDLSGLEKIRTDAMVTRERLLTEEEREAELKEARTEEAQTGGALKADLNEVKPQGIREAEPEQVKPEKTPEQPEKAQEKPEKTLEQPEKAQEKPDKVRDTGQEAALMPEPAKMTMTEMPTDELQDTVPGLDAVHTRILLDLLSGRPVADYIKEHRLMASVAADTINEALFDEIGDSVLSCDGDEIAIVEDYREDVLAFFSSN